MGRRGATAAATGLVLKDLLLLPRARGLQASGTGVAYTGQFSVRLPGVTEAAVTGVKEQISSLGSEQGVQNLTEAYSFSLRARYVPDRCW